MYIIYKICIMFIICVYVYIYTYTSTMYGSNQFIFCFNHFIFITSFTTDTVPERLIPILLLRKLNLNEIK